MAATKFLPYGSEGPAVQHSTCSRKDDLLLDLNVLL